MKPRSAVAAVAICLAGVIVGALVRRHTAPVAPAPLDARSPTGGYVGRQAPRLPTPVMGGARRGPAGELPAPAYHARDPDEWQGMLVNVAMQAECTTSAGCGLAMACIDQRCGPCTADSQCADGEECVLDHCVAAPQVACRTRRDCAGEGDDALCVLSGYASDPRGNGGMTASCQLPSGGTDQDIANHEPPETLPAPPIPVLPRDLLDSLPDGDEPT